ncbi:MAG: hypothetical protein KDD46_03630 [Bdellovibrionales bacterium]|nr:hypothetical protein [Bdellovibrionales bacterium]
MDAPFVPPHPRQIKELTLELPLPDSPYFEHSMVEIRIQKENEVERGVWTIDI